MMYLYYNRNMMRLNIKYDIFIIQTDCKKSIIDFSTHVGQSMQQIKQSGLILFNL